MDKTLSQSMPLDARIYVAGHRGMVGSALVEQLQLMGYQNLLLRRHVELDLTNQLAVQTFFSQEKPNYVFLAAAKVGGIHANATYPADFIYQNLMMEANIIQSAFENHVKRLLFLGSSCIYPKLAAQPMAESALLTGTLEATNEPYAIAKIAGIKLCESYNRQHSTDYRSVMPTNLYGKNDNFHPENSHVIPALLRRFHEATLAKDEKVVVWGSGRPMREFLHVDDMAAASIFVMNLDKTLYQSHTEPMLSHINVGCGSDISIKQLAGLVAKVVGFQGEIVFDPNQPDGTPKKLMDVSRLHAMGWRESIDLETGLSSTYDWFLSEQTTFRR